MTYLSWMKEFYPVEASKVTKSEALAHSLKKWEGALSKNLRKHGLDAPPLDFHAGNCALCKHHLYSGTKRRCSPCPLYKANNNKPCDHPKLVEKFTKRQCSVFMKYSLFEDPKPMVKLLRKAMKAHEAQQKESR